MIQIKNLTLRRGVKVVLKDATVTLNPGEKVGLRSEIRRPPRDDGR